MIFDRPHVTVLVDISGCAYDVRINDAPLIADVDGYPVSVEISVNHWICTGGNVLAVRLTERPSQEEDPLRPNCRVTLQVRDAHARTRLSQPIASLLHTGELQGSSQQERSPGRVALAGMGDVVIGDVAEFVAPGRRVMSRSVDLTLPFLRWSWLDGEVEPDKTAIKAALIPIYETIWRALRDGRALSIYPMFQERTSELAAAFYVSFADMERVLTLVKSVADDECELYPLDDESGLEISGDSKLARLVDRHGEPLIGFAYKDGSASEYYEMFFCKRGGRWRITR